MRNIFLRLHRTLFIHTVNIKSVITIAEGNVKGLFGIFNKRKHYKFQCLMFVRVNINGTICVIFHS